MAGGILVSFRGKAFKNSITLAAGAHNYVTGNAISAAAGLVFAFGNSLASLNSAKYDNTGGVLNAHASEDGRSVQLNGFRMNINANITPFACEMWFFSKLVTATDLAAFAPSNANLIDYFLGKINIATTDWTTINAAAAEIVIDNIDKVFMFGDPADYSVITGQMFGVLVARGAGAFTGSEVLSAQINVTKD